MWAQLKSDVNTAGDGSHNGNDELGDERDGIDDDGEERLECEDDEDWQHGRAEDKPDRCHRDRSHEQQQMNLLTTHLDNILVVTCNIHVLVV